MSSIYQLDPTRDTRWPEFVDSDPRSSIFHTVAWLEALRGAYGYQPLAFTTSPPGGPLENGWLFCRIESWLSGRRLVSLPFSDHCDVLATSGAAASDLITTVGHTLATQSARRIEVRPLQPAMLADGFLSPLRTFHVHSLDLTPDLTTLYSQFHRSCIQRKITRAQREGIVTHTGRSPSLLAAFWELLLMTRRRHQIPPQPQAWFRNLIDCCQSSLQIRVAYRKTQPIASILTLRHKSTLVFKYGCSNESAHNLGGMPLLFWQAIQEAKQSGCRVIDLGRTDLDNPGLAQFKTHLGAKSAPLTYYGRPAPKAAGPLRASATRAAHSAFGHMPDWALSAAGTLLYKHLA